MKIWNWLIKKKRQAFKLLDNNSFMECNVDRNYLQGFQRYVDDLLIKFLKKEDSNMPEIKYTIINDDGDNFKYEKAVVENKIGARTKIAAYRERIAEIKANMEKELTEIADIENEIAELEEVARIADAIRATTAEASPENAVEIVN